MTELETKLTAEVASLKEELAILRMALFGKKSERVIGSDDQLEFDLGLASTAPEQPKEEASTKSRKSRKSNKQKATKNPIKSKLTNNLKKSCNDHSESSFDRKL